MEMEEIMSLAEKGEPLVIKIYQNEEKYYVGSICIYPGKLRDALCDLYEEGKIKLFSDESEKATFIEKLRVTPPDQIEIEEIKNVLIEKDEDSTNFTDEQISEIGLDLYKQADENILLKRLLRKDLRWTFVAMMTNFDIEMSNSFLRILSTAQMRATNEIRKELDIPLLPKKKMKEFIDKPHRETENILLNTKPGGSRPRKEFTWSDKDKVEFYKVVESFPKIKKKSAWKYALIELFDVDFAIDMIEWLKNRPELKDIPSQLFDKAVASWRYFDSTSEVLESQFHPKLFVYLQAVNLLGFDYENELSTLETYYKEGKRLSKS